MTLTRKVTGRRKSYHCRSVYKTVIERGCPERKR